MMQPLSARPLVCNPIPTLPSVKTTDVVEAVLDSAYRLALCLKSMKGADIPPEALRDAINEIDPQGVLAGIRLSGSRYDVDTLSTVLSNLCFFGKEYFSSAAGIDKKTGQINYKNYLSRLSSIYSVISNFAEKYTTEETRQHTTQSTLNHRFSKAEGFSGDYTLEIVRGRNDRHRDIVCLMIQPTAADTPQPTVRSVLSDLYTLCKKQSTSQEAILLDDFSKFEDRDHLISPKRLVAHYERLTKDAELVPGVTRRLVGTNEHFASIFLRVAFIESNTPAVIARLLHATFFVLGYHKEHPQTCYLEGSVPSLYESHPVLTSDGVLHHNCDGLQMRDNKGYDPYARLVVESSF